MTAFLRLFGEFRAAEARIIAADAEIAFLRQTIGSLQDKITETQQFEREATRKVADFAAGTRFGRSVFDVTSEIPTPPLEMRPVATVKPQATNLVALAERRFMEEINKQRQQTA